jgi:hypothetical protein
MLVLATMAVAAPNSMGIRDVNNVTFGEPMRVGSVVLPAGDYVVRHTMEGQDHVMVFQRLHSKDEFKVEVQSGCAAKEGGQNPKQLRDNRRKCESAARDRVQGRFRQTRFLEFLTVDTDRFPSA